MICSGCMDSFRSTREEEKKKRTLWKTCSRRISCNLAFRSLTRDAMSCNLSLSLLSIWPVSPITRSSFILMPPLGLCAESHADRPEVDEGTKQILWSPASWAVKVKRPEAEPRWETTRWLLSKTSCAGVSISLMKIVHVLLLPSTKGRRCCWR